MEEIKEAMKPRELEHIDSEIVRRLSEYKQESPAMLQKHIEVIREFFLKEVAPKTLAVSGGTLQATEVIQRLLNTEVDSVTAARFQQMANRATTLKMAMFVCKYFDLPESYLESVIGIPAADDPMRKLTQMIAESNQHLQHTLKNSLAKVERNLREISD